MDPLSDVLRAVRLTGAYFYLVEAARDWSVASTPAREIAPRILPESEHLIAYHVVSEGECWGGVDGGERLRLRAGDVIVFPHGDAHTMASAPVCAPGVEEQSASPARYPATVTIGRGPAATRLVCGFLGCDARPFNPLIAALPRVVHMPSAGSGGWLATFPEQAVLESRNGAVGAETMLTRMAELMFIEVLRRYIDALGEEQVGWFAALRDPVVGKALRILHERPAEAWTLPELAREAAASRTVLAERFAQMVGVPPMQYLAKWRLQLAAELLARGSVKVAAVGMQVGYESESAFSRAFKRETGVAPGVWGRRGSGD